jgi:hypothetical protein
MDSIEQKAKELFDKFHYQICNDCGISESDSTETAAKQCALIDVQNTIEGIMEVIGSQRHMWSEHQLNVIRTYEKVKEKIQSL